MEVESAVINIKKKGQITLPVAFRTALGLEEDDQLEVSLEDGRVVLTPVITIAKDQAWFWKKEWQEGEREAQHDIDTGNVKSFTDVEDAIASLRNGE
ncbi:hypothetical protein B0X71_03270 [Planococcus lenghuensis]|uniref:SpoVT-AbrB domain-containing protein n=1 Tax=Planococcus lenghuensis TaxID=2213202 RepID=A0A1Q2L4H8_9BACL|nr:hypothetical protein B0X71_03270 [Planococcus lenghuensis]